MSPHRTDRPSRATLAAALLCAACGGDADAPTVVVPPPPDRSVVRLDIPLDDFSILLNVRMRLPVAAYTAAGDTVPRPAELTFVSRDPSIVPVDPDGTITASRLGGQAWIVAIAQVGARTLADSVRVTVTCTSDLRSEVVPGQATLQVGDTLTLHGRLLGCLGQLVLTDTLVWSTSDSSVARVDAATGLVTARAPGTAWVGMLGQHYPAGAGAPVTVRPAP